MKRKKIKNKVYQLSKLNGVYWWTGTSMLDHVPDEDTEYKWTSDFRIVEQLNGKKIN